MNQQKFNSIQEFGYNRFRVPHSTLASYNMGIAYPLGFVPVPMGASVRNSIEAFMRSSALVDPSFLDADINIGHYFVSYEAMDPYYKIRTQNFKGAAQDQAVPALTMDDQVNLDVIGKYLAPGQLLDHLGFGVDWSADPDSNTFDKAFVISAYPILAYNMIVDRFFRNSRLQDVELTRKFCLAKFASASLPTLSFEDFLQQDAVAVAPRILTELQYINYEPDYFTTARPIQSGVAVPIPEGDNATIPNLLDAMLMQKVADMIERGGYSYNDYARILYGVTPDETSVDYPIFLGGSSSPLQVSTVVNQLGAVGTVPEFDPLGAEAGRVTGFLGQGNGFERRFLRAGIYMPIMWIRPKSYYRSGFSAFFKETTIGSQLLPQLADLQDAPIYHGELTAPIQNVLGGYAQEQVFGFKDRYQEYRSIPNRVVGELRQDRTGWYITRGLPDGTGGTGSAIVNGSFISQNNIVYSPWVVTDEKKDHFFARVEQQMELTLPLPQTSKPYVW